MDKDYTSLQVSDLFIKEVNQYKKSLMYFDYESATINIVNHFYDLGHSVEETLQALKLINSNNKRRVRCYDKTIYMFDNYECVYFGTLTFKDDVLDKTNPTTRRKYVSRFLKSISECYIANIDYGDKVKNPQSNEREHYHCLIATNKCPNSWQYGFCKFKKVFINDLTNEDLSAKCLSKYIVKLSRHALKQSKNGKAPRLIYSKCVAPPWLLE